MVAVCEPVSSVNNTGTLKNPDLFTLNSVPLINTLLVGGCAFSPSKP